MKKFLFFYASFFSLIWTGYGLYAVTTNQPSAGLMLSFGVAFSIVTYVPASFIKKHLKK